MKRKRGLRSIDQRLLMIFRERGLFNYVFPRHTMAICHDCSGEYKSGRGMSVHLSKSDCERPELSQRQKEITTGLFMGDAWVKNYMAMDTKTLEFVEWLQDELAVLYPTVVDRKMEDKNHADLKRIRFISNPWFEKLEEWYEKDGKSFPDDLELTPLMLKVWYVCDGGIYDGYTWDVRIAADNERDGNLEKLFKSTPLNPDIYYKPNVVIRFGVDEREKFFDYIGNSISGFEYKWRNQNE